MDATKCLSNTQWELYSQQKLSLQELYLLRSHAAACEICADIKEGIDHMNNASNLVQTVSRINDRIDDKLGFKRTAVIPMYFWLSAAAVLVIGIGILFFPLPKEESVAVINDTTSPTSLLPLSDAKPEQQVLVQPKEVVKPNVKPKVAIERSTKSANQTEENESFSLAEDVSISKALSEEVEEKSVIELKENKAAFSAKKEALILPSNRMANANSDFELSLNNTNAVSVIDSTEFKELLRLIADEKFVKATEKAELLKKNEYFKEDALWFLAEIYQKEGNVEQRKITLQQLVQLNGKYKERAEKLLVN